MKILRVLESSGDRLISFDDTAATALAHALFERMLARGSIAFKVILSGGGDRDIAGIVLLLVPSGVLLFSAHAADLYANPLFRVKLAVIGLALANVLLFHMRTFRSVASWDARVPGRDHRAGPIQTCEG